MTDQLEPGTAVLVAMSGGVDSSMAAYRLLKSGMSVVGATMYLAGEKDCAGTPSGPTGPKACCSIGGAQDARKVAEFLGFPHYVLDLRKEFEKFVVKPSRLQYSLGRTPNPCVLCNRFIKFDILLKRAAEFGCSHIATGHYARTFRNGSGWHLLRGLDKTKDQSYFLACLTSHELERVVFPLGTENKSDIRDEARRIGLPVANRRESQDLCFFAKEDPALSRPDDPRRRGEIVKTDGSFVGYHNGIEEFTIGQRKGIPGSEEIPLYVIEIDPVSRRVTVGSMEETFASRFTVEDLSLVDFERDISRLNEEVEVELRYRTKPVLCRVFPDGTGGASVELAHPARAVTPGQVAVFYAGEEVLGNGTISRVIREQTGAGACP